MNGTSVLFLLGNAKEKRKGIQVISSYIQWKCVSHNSIFPVLKVTPQKFEVISVINLDFFIEGLSHIMTNQKVEPGVGGYMNKFSTSLN